MTHKIAADAETKQLVIQRDSHGAGTLQILLTVVAVIAAALTCVYAYTSFEAADAIDLSVRGQILGAFAISLAALVGVNKVATTRR